MSKGVYVATIEPNSGKSVVVLGLMRMLLGKTAKVGYFRPIIDDNEEGEMDNHINTVVCNKSINQVLQKLKEKEKAETGNFNLPGIYE